MWSENMMICGKKKAGFGKNAKLFIVPTIQCNCYIPPLKYKIWWICDIMVVLSVGLLFLLAVWRWCDQPRSPVCFQPGEALLLLRHTEKKTHKVEWNSTHLHIEKLQFAHEQLLKNGHSCQFAYLVDHFHPLGQVIKGLLLCDVIH